MIENWGIGIRVLDPLPILSFGADCDEILRDYPDIVVASFKIASLRQTWIQS